jgi:hypothetical protein
LSARAIVAASLIFAAIFAAAVAPCLAQVPIPPSSPIHKDQGGDERGTRIAEAMEPLKLNIEQMEAQLQRDDLNDASLLRSRGSLDPVRDELREIIASLERRLDDVDTRMKQIGDPPAAGAPPEESGARRGTRALAGAAYRARRLAQAGSPLDAARRQFVRAHHRPAAGAVHARIAGPQFECGRSEILVGSGTRATGRPARRGAADARMDRLRTRLRE